MLVPYTEKDFSFRAETVDEILEFLEVYSGQKKQGLRSELTGLGLRSKKTGQFFESKKCGFWIGYDRQRDDYIIYRKDVYDPSNLFFVLYDLIVTPTNLPVEEEIEYKTDAVERYFSRAAEMEEDSFEEEKEEVLKLTRQMVEVTRSFDDGEFDEDEMEQISDAIDKTYFAPLETVFNGIIDRIAEPRINIKVDSPDHLIRD